MPDSGGIRTDLSNTTYSGGWVPSGFKNNSGGSSTGLFSPAHPILPAQPLERPRIFQYTPGVNLMILPRAGFGLTSFPILRMLASACKEVRLNIELIKRELRSLDSEIVPTDEKDPHKDDYGADIQDVERFFENPDGMHDYAGWLNQIIEETLVTDALTIYPDLDLSGQLQEVNVIDGTTIRPVLDYRGKVAKRPAPSYVQVLYGMPAGYWFDDELIYRPLNPSVFSPYGASPLEWIILTVNLALRRESAHLAHYTEGNIPAALLGVPATWDQSAIDAYQAYWDALVTGKIENQSKLQMVPMGGAGSAPPVYEFGKDDIDSTAQDTWLMRVACWAFGNNPMEFGLTDGSSAGLGGSGYAGQMQNIQFRSQIEPMANFIGGLINVIIHKYLRKPWLSHKWIGLDPQEDELKQAQTDAINLQQGIYDLSYVQDRESIPVEHRPKERPPQATVEGLPGMEGLAKSFFRDKESPNWPDYP